MAYKTIVGLEIHVELATQTKGFCSCENSFGGEPNTRVCPVCLAYPGAMPTLNREVVNYSMMAAMALNAQIQPKSYFDRKNYFYPDLTKGYQITQNLHPVALNGYLDIEGEEGMTRVHIDRIQIEEDTGKSMHTEDGTTLMDYNRCGVPLIEIVTAPDLTSAKDTRLFLEQLRNTIRYIGISDVKMEEGSLRCDVNVNVKDLETGKRTSIAEIKNLNSFRGVERAIEYEVERQIELLKEGKEEPVSTRRWDDVKNITFIMRDENTVTDYRFAPENDLGPLTIDEEWIDSIRKRMPELPVAKKERFMETYDLSEYNASVLTQTQVLADYYEEVAKKFDDYTMIANWVLTEILRRVEIEDQKTLELPFSVDDFVELLGLVKEDKINHNAGQKTLKKMFETAKSPKVIVEEEGLLQISDDSKIEAMVDEVLEDNPDTIQEYLGGRDRVLGFLVGQVMKASRGQANPKTVNEMLVKKIKEHE